MANLRFMKNVTLISDLESGTTERVIPQGTHNYVKYASSISYHSKVMANVKVKNATLILDLNFHR